ncbi:hypothetical protein FGO68_gene14800 [Halteria grandinella]|uniref:Uncharacterized protein n=1 Tax=Halteria grandinella TaxID=5974 RepID=A0A8J8NQZ3_HALGN|nr:hypothetical protein FGO68_gene14800 [Halteria grandinella]
MVVQILRRFSLLYQSLRLLILEERYPQQQNSSIQFQGKKSQNINRLSSIQFKARCLLGDLVCMCLTAVYLCHIQYFDSFPRT